MSGIFGIIRAPGAPVLESELEAMADALKHRGPDGIHYNVRGNAGLGHCMLQSTPESLHETLPFRDDAAGLTITSDARIDNREQLMSDIPMRPLSGRVISDSQLILYAYIKWQEGCVDHLLGDFAFAIWDERNQSLFVARDHMGCKPFYYHCHEGLFVFASSAMAVACVTEVKATLNEGRVADYLVQELEGINKTCSWYNEINRMPPAHCGYYRRNFFAPRQYWVLEPDSSLQLISDTDYLGTFTQRYTEAVRVRLRCQMEPASMLSGGLDSSTIVALARQLLAGERKPPLRTYSGMSDKGELCHETVSIEAVVAQGGLVSKYLHPSGMDVYAEPLAANMQALEDPFDGSWTLLALMFLLAAQDGGRMLLTGLDGEHAVGAPANYINHLLRRKDLLGAWGEAQGLSRHYHLGESSALTLYLKALRSLLLPDRLRKLKRLLGASGRYRRLIAGQMISPELAKRARLESRLFEYERSMQLSYDANAQDWHKHAIHVPYLTAAIERYERLATYFGVEARHPLLDKRLLELSCALPLRQKARDGWSKYQLRLIADKYLPQSVAWRKNSEPPGWKFTARHEQIFSVNEGFPGRDMREVLAPYMSRQKLAQFCETGAGVGTNSEFDVWIAYQLYQWLRYSGQCVDNNSY